MLSAVEPKVGVAKHLYYAINQHCCDEAAEILGYADLRFGCA